MAAKYDIIKDFYGIDQGEALNFVPDKIDTSPSWIVVVFPFKEEVTFERRRMKSYDTDPSQAVRVDAPLVITNDCISLQVQSTKDSFQGSLQATLIHSDTNYLVNIKPGDWCLAWMLQNETDAADVLTRIKQLSPQNPCNAFMDGLKFVGRVRSLRKHLLQSPEGQRTVQYALQAASFSEFEANIFYDPGLADNKNGSIGAFLAALDTRLNAFFTAKENIPGIETSKAIPFLLTLLLGRGLSSLFTSPLPSSGVPSEATGLTGQDPSSPPEEAPYAYLVPPEVGTLLGKTSPSKPSGILSAADLDEVLIGVQNYTGDGTSLGTFTQGPDGKDDYTPGVSAPGVNSGLKVASAPEQIFTPDGLNSHGENDNHKFTRVPVSGVFLPDMPNFTGQHNVWTILSQYLNPSLNEMYTALRVNDKGLVVPTVVVRQIPFTSDVFAASLTTSDPTLTNTRVPAGNLPVTRFLELPRWVVDPLMVVSADLGSSDAKRCNFVHIYGQAAISLPPQALTWQIVNNPPIEDQADIRRSGLRASMSTVACAPADISKNQGASKWMAINADFRMGMHLTLDGTINTHGIQAPIVPGDNLEFDGAVYHLETVLHTCQISPGGRRSFYTTLQVVHGIRSESSPVVVKSLFADQTIFAAQNPDDQITYDPGLSRDSGTQE